MISTHPLWFPYTPPSARFLPFTPLPPPPTQSTLTSSSILSLNPPFSSFQNLPFHRPFSPAFVFPHLPVSQPKPPPPPPNFTASSSLFSPRLFKPLLSHSAPSPPLFSHSSAPMPSHHPPPPSRRTPLAPTRYLPSSFPSLSPPSTCRSACLSVR